MSNEIIIEEKVPLPSSSRTKKVDPMFGIFAKMNVGDSILVNERENNRLVQSSASNYKLKIMKGKWSYASRTQPDGKIRIWRTK
jgi:hypothetical protein